MSMNLRVIRNAQYSNKIHKRINDTVTDINNNTKAPNLLALTSLINLQQTSPKKIMSDLSGSIPRNNKCGQAHCLQNYQ